jgi:hypothetical protein
MVGSSSCALFSGSVSASESVAARRHPIGPFIADDQGFGAEVKRVVEYHVRLQVLCSQLRKPEMSQKNRIACHNLYVTLCGSRRLKRPRLSHQTR